MSALRKKMLGRIANVILQTPRDAQHLALDARGANIIVMNFAQRDIHNYNPSPTLYTHETVRNQDIYSSCYGANR